VLAVARILAISPGTQKLQVPLVPHDRRVARRADGPHRAELSLQLAKMSLLIQTWPTIEWSATVAESHAGERLAIP
jgi:hypothetical protein